MWLETKTGEKTQRNLALFSLLCTPEASNKTKGETLDVATCVNVRIPAMPFIPSKTSMAMAVMAIMVAPALILMCMNKSVEGYTIFPKREREGGSYVVVMALVSYLLCLLMTVNSKSRAQLRWHQIHCGNGGRACNFVFSGDKSRIFHVYRKRTPMLHGSRFCQLWNFDDWYQTQTEPNVFYISVNSTRKASMVWTM